MSGCLSRGKTRSDFARSTGEGCGPLRLEAQGIDNRDARYMMSHTNFLERRQEMSEEGSSKAPSVDLTGIPGLKRAKRRPVGPCEATYRAPPGLFRQFLDDVR